MQSIRDWLGTLGLSQYAPVFEDNDIDLTVLPKLSESHLEQLGVRSIGHRLRIIEAARSKMADAQAPSVNVASGIDPHAAELRSAERRQLTILFCDLVGSTQLSQQLDPERLRELMQAYQQACRAVMEKYEGHVAQYLGDGLMVYFGWPRAHEDDAERAVRAGLEIIESIKHVKAPQTLQVRIGIATGTVVVGETGSGDASVPKLAVGETPNLAARLQGVAAADQIVIASTTHRLVKERFDYFDLGAQTLKGILEPVRAWRVLALREWRGRFEAQRGAELTPMVGREEEIASLQRRWDKVTQGEGAVVLLGGEPGIGKSRITRVLSQHVEQQVHTRLECHCASFYGNTAFHPFVGLVRQMAGLVRDDSIEAQVQGLLALMARLAIPGMQALPLLATMLSLDASAHAALSVMSPQRQKEETIKLLAAMILALAVKQPVLLLVEDVHWIDPSSLEALDLIVARAQERSVMLLITFRPEFSPRWVGQSHVAYLNLNRLARRQIFAMSQEVTGGAALPDSVLEEIARRTEGVPLFVEELTRAVLETGVVKRVENRYELVGPMSAINIPATLQDSLMARLDRLGSGKDVAQLGACIGREFSFELLCAVAELPRDAVEASLAQLVASELVFQRGVPPQAVYSFKHALIQDAAYASLLNSKKQLLHAAIAQVMERKFSEQSLAEPEVIAHHCAGAGMHAEAVRYWKLAGERAMARFANSEALGHLEKALWHLEQLPPTNARDEQELSIQIVLGTALLATRGFSSEDVRKTFGRAKDLSANVTDTSALLMSLYGMMLYHLVRAEYRECVALTKELVTAEARGQLEGGEVRRDVHIALVECFVGNFSSARELSESASRTYLSMQRAGEIGVMMKWDHIGMSTFDYSAWSHWFLGYLDTAKARREVCIDMAMKGGIPFSILTALTHGAFQDYLAGNVEEALSVAQRVVVLADEDSNLFRKAEGQIIAGWAMAELGDIDAGLVQLREGYELLQMIGAHIVDAVWLSMYARAYWKAGQLGEARQALDRAMAHAIATGEGMYVAELHRLNAELLLAENPTASAAAERHLRQAMEVARGQQAKILELRACVSLARLLKSQGKRGEIRELLAPVYGWFTEGLDSADLREAKALIEEGR